MKKIILIGIMAGMFAFTGIAGAVMGAGGTGMTTGSTGMMGTVMQMPMSKQMFDYAPTTGPVMGTDISTTMPIGVGPVAMGGNMITIHAAIGEFSNPMDMYLTLYAPADDPFDIYTLQPDGTIEPVSAGTVPWMTGVTSIDQTPVSNVPTAWLPKGTYTVGLIATPTGGNMSTYYMWTTHFVVQ